jgi:hypothetical protein
MKKWEMRISDKSDSRVALFADVNVNETAQPLLATICCEQPQAFFTLLGRPFST